ncbi:tetraspanin-13-like [Arapaima gigas]
MEEGPGIQTAPSAEAFKTSGSRSAGVEGYRFLNVELHLSHLELYVTPPRAFRKTGRFRHAAFPRIDLHINDDLAGLTIQPAGSGASLRAGGDAPYSMACIGFSCSKNSLCALNILYVMVSLLMIGIAAWGKWFGLVSSFQVVGGVIGVGVFLFLVALVGLIGAVKHHQVLLFFYMIVLFMVFVVQFSVSCASLAITREQQNHLLEVGWNNSQSTQRDVEKSLNCCGFNTVSYTDTCDAICFAKHVCEPCAAKIQEHAGEVLRFVGGVGLFFSFTEILGVWLTYRYRNQKDPRANPSAFL